MQAVVIEIFSLMAALLAALAVNAAAVALVVARTNEIGVRMALGARPWGIAGMVLRQGLRPVKVGLALGIGLAWLGHHQGFMRDWLFNPRTLEVSWAVGIGLGILSMTGVALVTPAWAAGRRSPLSALRYE